MPWRQWLNVIFKDTIDQNVEKGIESILSEIEAAEALLLNVFRLSLTLVQYWYISCNWHVLLEANSKIDSDGGDDALNFKYTHRSKFYNSKHFS